MPADGRCFFHAVSCSEHGFPEWKQLSADVRVSRAKALTDLLQGSLPVDVYESYRLGRSVEEEHLETICRALHTYERMHVSRDQDAAFAFGRPEDRHVDLLLCSCESGAEHFDLLIPTVSPNLPKAFKIKARYFDDILDGQKKVESRTDTQKLRKMLHHAAARLRSGKRMPVHDCPSRSSCMGHARRNLVQLGHQ